LDVRIFNRPIKASPLEIIVTAHQSPLNQFASVGSAAWQLCQPTRVLTAADDDRVYVLDTGNCRGRCERRSFKSDLLFTVQTVSLLENIAVASITGDALAGQSAVGLALCRGTVTADQSTTTTTTLMTLNWRARSVAEHCPHTGRQLRTFSFSEFVEPIDLCVDTRGRILVADNGARKVFVFDHCARPVFSFTLAVYGCGQTIKSPLQQQRWVLLESFEKKFQL
jgi:tripartite motif-containing protein 2/3